MFAFTSVTLIILSVIVLVLRETPNIRSRLVLNRMELSFNVIFTAEIVLRLAIVDNAWQALDLYLAFDLLSVMPFWVNLALKYKVQSFLRFEIRKKQYSVVRKFREMFKALRMLRLLKLTRRYDGSIVIVQSLSDSAAALTAPLCFFSVAVILAGAFLYLVEEDQPTKEAYDKKDHRFQSVLHAIWFMIVTFLTVGFGDTYPMTIQGKVLTAIAMFVGIFTMAMIYAIVGNNFVRVWDQKDTVIFLQKLKEHFNHMSVTRKDVERTFKELDEDGSGALDFDEFCSALTKVDVTMTEKRKRALWQAIDYNHQGEIKMREFVELVFKRQGGNTRLMIDDLLHEDMDQFQKRQKPLLSPKKSHRRTSISSSKPSQSRLDRLVRSMSNSFRRISATIVPVDSSVPPALVAPTRNDDSPPDDDQNTTSSSSSDDDDDEKNVPTILDTAADDLTMRLPQPRRASDPTVNLPSEIIRRSVDTFRSSVDDDDNIAVAARLVQVELDAVLREQRALCDAHQRLAATVNAGFTSNFDDIARQATLLHYAKCLLDHADALQQPAIADDLHALIAGIATVNS